MKKVKTFISKSALESVKELNHAFINLGKSTSKFKDSVTYLKWLTTFKPQSQSIINTILITGIVLALAEIVWFWLTKY